MNKKTHKTILERNTPSKNISSGIPLAEAVIVNGLPFFLQIVDDKPSLYEKIELPDMILKPIDRISYLNKEYSFTSLDEDQSVRSKSLTRNLRYSISKVKSNLEEIH